MEKHNEPNFAFYEVITFDEKEEPIDYRIFEHPHLLRARAMAYAYQMYRNDPGDMLSGLSEDLKISKGEGDFKAEVFFAYYQDGEAVKIQLTPSEDHREECENEVFILSDLGYTDWTCIEDWYDEEFDKLVQEYAKR